MNGSTNKYSMGHSDRGALKLYRIYRYLYLRGWQKTSRLFKYLNTIIFKCFIPAEVKLGVRVELPHGGFGVVMHEDVIIGDDVIIFHLVTIGNGGARIANNVTIGAGAIIIGAVNIGKGAVVGAGTTITKDVPPGAVVVNAEPRIMLQKSKNYIEN